MKILLAQKLTYIPALTGATKEDRVILQGLAERKHSCRVVTLASAVPGTKGRAQFLGELAARGIKIISSSSAVDIFHYKGVEVHAVSDGFQLCAHLIDQIRQFEPTWTLVSEDPLYLCLAAALEVSPSCVVYLAHSQATLPFGPECFAADPMKAELLRQAAGIIPVSNYLKDYIKEWGGLNSDYFPIPTYGTGPFPRFGCFDKGFVTMVNPSAIKGVPIFLELARRLPDVQFAAVPTWATTNTDRIALEQFRNVRVLNPVENIDEIFAQTRILLVPSLWGEAFGKVVVEAMLRGIPVLASNIGGLPEAKLGIDYLLPVRPIERYHDRIDDRLLPVPVVPDQDTDPWLEALQKLLSDRGHYDHLSAVSREAALKYVSSLDFTPFEDFLEDLAPAASSTVYDGGVAKTGQHDQKTEESPELPENLSPQRLELLKLLLRNNTDRDSQR